MQIRHYFARSMYFFDSVSILIFSPVVMKRGTLIIAPAATFAGCGVGGVRVKGGDSERGRWVSRTTGVVGGRGDRQTERRRGEHGAGGFRNGTGWDVCVRRQMDLGVCATEGGAFLVQGLLMRRAGRTDNPVPPQVVMRMRTPCCFDGQQEEDKRRYVEKKTATSVNTRDAGCSASYLPRYQSGRPELCCKKEPHGATQKKKKRGRRRAS